MTFSHWIIYILRRIFLPHSLRTMEWRMLRLVNKDRKTYDLISLRMQDDLRDVARKHSRDMARKDYFEHENILGQTPFDRLENARVTDIQSGENLAKIRGHKNPVVRAEIGLMNSPGHRANILNEKYNTVGIGIIKSVDQSYYFTQNFARRELIFRKKIPKTATLKRGIHMKGDVFTPVKSIIYQIKRSPQSKKILKEELVNVKKNKFNFHIKFAETGIFHVLVFVNKTGQKGRFAIANKFEIKFRKSWFFG